MSTFGCSSKAVSLSKDKIRYAEGTAVVPDVRESAKLGVSFSYCKSDVSFYVFGASTAPILGLPPPQLPPTAPTGS